MPEKLLLQSNFISGITSEFLVSSQALYIRLNNLKCLDLYKSVPVATCKSCGNTDFSQSAKFCKICGSEINSATTKGIMRILYNPDPHADDASRKCNCGHENDTNARYCELCVELTLAFNSLADWKIEKDQYVKSLARENFA